MLPTPSNPPALSPRYASVAHVPPELHWHPLLVSGKAEKPVAAALCDLGVVHYLPMDKSECGNGKLAVLYPNYVFVAVPLAGLPRDSAAASPLPALPDFPSLPLRLDLSHAFTREERSRAIFSDLCHVLRNRLKRRVLLGLNVVLNQPALRRELLAIEGGIANGTIGRHNWATLDALCKVVAGSFRGRFGRVVPALSNNPAKLTLAIDGGSIPVEIPRADLVPAA
jgi:hypothetical protein